MASPGMWQSDQRYYTDRPPGDPRARVVPSGSPEAAFVLVGAGGEILLTEAERFGLVQIREERVTEVKEPFTEPAPETTGAVPPDVASDDGGVPMATDESVKTEASAPAPSPAPKRVSGKG